MSQQYNLGKVALTPKGTFNANATYERLDVVTRNGSSYLVLQSCTGITPPNETYYQLIASKGNAGTNGSAATITAGTVTMLPVGSSATVTNSGTSSNAIFDFGIPYQSIEDGSVTTEKLGADVLLTIDGIDEAIAQTYSDTAVYEKGSYAWYNGTLYRAKVNITTAESFDADNWIPASIGSYMGDLTTEITNLDSAVFSTLGEELTNTVGGTEPTVSAGSWFEFSPRLLVGNTYKIRLLLTGWSQTQLSKITRIALYRSNSNSDLITELNFGTLVSGETLEATITITGDYDARYIKLSLASSYSAETNSVSIQAYKVTPRKTFVGDLRDEYESGMNTVELHLSYYPTKTRHISANNVWGNQASKASIFIPVDQAVKLSVTGHATNGSEIALLKSDNSATTGITPDYVTGWTAPMTIPAGETVTVIIPSEARVIYVANDTNDTLLPSAIIKTIPVNRVSKKVPIFSFMDDDARAVALSWLEQVVDATRIPISIALITGVVGDTVQDEGLYSSWETIRRLKNKGFDFVNHTNTTVAITTMTLAEVEQSFKISQQLMEAHGLPHSDILVLPGGNTDADRTALAQNYFRCMMSTTPNLNLPPINTWYLSRVSMEGFTLAEQKAYVDQAIEMNAWCIFYGHAYHEVYDQTKLEEFVELVNYIAEKGGQILSVSDAFERYRNNLTGDTSYGCDSVIC